MVLTFLEKDIVGGLFTDDYFFFLLTLGKSCLSKV